MNWLKNKNAQIGVGIAVIIILIAGFFIIRNNSASEAPEAESQEDTIQKISAEELGLTLEANSSGNEVKFLISKAADIESLEYELTYEADSTAAEQSEGGEPRVQRGITGQDTLNGDSSYESELLVLGSESAGTKRYDTGVESVDLTLKIVKNDGKTYSSEESLEL